MNILSNATLCNLKVWKTWQYRGQTLGRCHDSLRLRANARNVSFGISLRWPIHQFNQIILKINCFDLISNVIFILFLSLLSVYFYFVSILLSIYFYFVFSLVLLNFNFFFLSLSLFLLLCYFYFMSSSFLINIMNINAIFLWECCATKIDLYPLI